MRIGDFVRCEGHVRGCGVRLNWLVTGVHVCLVELPNRDEGRLPDVRSCSGVINRKGPESAIFLDGR